MDLMTRRGEHHVADAYRLFADCEADGLSATYADWARHVADDTAVLDLLRTLPPLKRQPNLVFAAARWHGAGTTYASFQDAVVGRWDDVRATVLARRTQTNEAGRCATLLPWLAGFRQPLALLEVGASAGLCLLPDRYSYRYLPADGGPVVALDPADGVSDVVLECRLGPGVTPPTALPDVVWRAGLDLAPVDVTDDDACRWLRTLVWPEHPDRRERLTAALAVARRDPPRVVAGDLVEALADLAAEAPADATLVVLHSAVLAYVTPEGRRRFVEQVSALPGHWVSNEGARVLGLPGTEGAAVTDGRFVVAVDGVPVGWAQPHGRELEVFTLGG